MASGCPAIVPVAGRVRSSATADGCAGLLTRFFDSVRIRRALCRNCHRTITVLPCFCIPGAPFSAPARREVMARLAEGRTLEDVAPVCLNPNRVATPYTVRRWAWLRTTAQVMKNPVATAGATAQESETNAYWNPNAPGLRALVACQAVTGPGGSANGSVTELVYDAFGNLEQQRAWDSAKQAAPPTCGASAQLTSGNALITSHTFMWRIWPTKTTTGAGLKMGALESVRILEVWRALGGPELRRGRAPAFWRSGDNPQAIAIDAEKGCWYDHRDNCGGGVLRLVQHVRSTSCGVAKQRRLNCLPIQTTTWDLLLSHPNRRSHSNPY
jgi:hypothetical protein